MALDQRMGLVGRDETVALVELLVRSRPLPILLAFGPGGSGKSALLDHVERRYRGWPVSRVNLDGMGSTECREVLAAIVDDLRDYAHPEFGSFRLPRYTLARLAMAAAAEANAAEADRQTLARNLLAVRLTKLPKVPQVIAAAADLMPAMVGSVFKILQPAMSMAASFGVSSPRWLRSLLVGPRLAKALRWYETVAIRDNLLGLPAPAKAPTAVVELWRHLGKREPASQRRVDQLLVAAFLADIDAMFRRRRRRKVTCVVLLDGADMLEPFADSLFQPSRGESMAPANNFLELLAEARLTTPDVPLLVIATKQAQPDGLDRPDRSPDPTSADPAHAARARYEAWLARFGDERTARDMYLSVPLLPFTPNQTAQFLAEWSRTQDYPVAEQTLIRELHQVTCGHPLAVELAVRATGLRFRANNARPAVRDAFARRLPEGQHTAESDLTIGEYLLFRFLQRFRGGDDIAERRRTQELLARLAAARRIDVGTIGLLVPDRDPQDVLDRLRKYSFANTVVVDGQEFLTLHPLLRDLLARHLLAANGGVLYRSVHQKLRDRYRSIRNQTEELYHCLALGEDDLVSRELRDRARSGDPAWPAMLDSIAEAPLVDDDRRLGQLVRKAQHAIVPEIAVVHDLVLATWKLRSATSTDPSLPRLFDRVADAYDAVGKRLNGHNDKAIEEHAASYRKMADSALEHGRELTITPLPAACGWDQRVAYPPHWLPRRLRNGVGLAAVGLLIAGYATVFVTQQRGYCDIGGPMDAPAVVGSFVDPTLYLARESSGECVGLTTSATVFAYGDRANPTDPTEAKDLNEIAELSRLIYQENQGVDRMVAENSRRSVTVVVATMLSTVNAQPYRDLTLGVNELRGAYLAQQQWNQLDTQNLWPKFFVRLALANLGGDSAYATDAADKIKNYSLQNPSVIAVTGMGQTRSQTLAAARMLGNPADSWSGIPIVTTAPTGNEFVGMRDVFMTAATDSRQAQVAADFIRSRPDLAGRRIFVVYDPSDPYSSDLDGNYSSALQADSLSVYTHKEYGADSLTAGYDINNVARTVCAAASNPLVIYAGRANEFPTLVGDLGDNGCGLQAVLIGDDDLTQTETENYQDLSQLPPPAQVSGHVYYTSFAAACPDLSMTDNAACAAKDKFTSLYATDAATERVKDNGAAFQTGWNGEIMLAYDAVSLVLGAANRASVVDRDRVQASLAATTGAGAYPGVAGPIDFAASESGGSAEDGVDTRKQVVVQEILAEPGRPGELVPHAVYHES